jgi:hypothetical protein
MSLPEPKFISEKEVPTNKQEGMWQKLLAKIPKGQSATLTFESKEEAIRRQQNVVSILCQQKKQGKYVSIKATRTDKTIYITNYTEEK